jgi:hypothetical protein
MLTGCQRVVFLAPRNEIVSLEETRRAAGTCDQAIALMFVLHGDFTCLKKMS